MPLTTGNGGGAEGGTRGRERNGSHWAYVTFSFRWVLQAVPSSKKEMGCWFYRSEWSALKIKSLFHRAQEIECMRPPRDVMYTEKEKGRRTKPKSPASNKQTE